MPPNYLPVAGHMPPKFLLHLQLHLLVACAPTFSSIPNSIFPAKECSCFRIYVSLPTIKKFKTVRASKENGLIICTAIYRETKEGQRGVDESKLDAEK